MMSTFGLVFDLLILVALVITIRQAIRLNRDFAQMQADRKAFENLIAALNIAASRAESAIKNLKETAIESGDALQGKINTARNGIVIVRAARVRIWVGAAAHGVRFGNKQRRSKSHAVGDVVILGAQQNRGHSRPVAAFIGEIPIADEIG